MKFLRFMMMLVLMFALALPASAMTGNRNEPAHYVAIGDSLAAGILYDRTKGIGFNDVVAAKLKEDKLLASFNDDFAFPRYKTTDVLNMIDNNVKSPSPQAKEDLTIVEVIKRADVITLTIGANDILSSVEFDPESQTLKYDINAVRATIAKTGENVAEILQKIKAINPQADVFVTGLYNPFPTIMTEAFVLNLMVEQIDTALKTVTEKNDFIFVPIKQAIAQNPSVYLPNPADIHPSEAGYQAIADELYGPVKEYIGLIPTGEIIPEPPTEKPIPNFKDVKPTLASYPYIVKATQAGIMNGYDNGTFRPNGKLTRVHVTSMLARMMPLTDTTKKPPYTDISKLADKTKHEITLAYNANLLKETKKFGPNTPMSRVEFAEMVDAAYYYMMGRVYHPEKTAPFTDIGKLTADQKRVITLLYDFGISTGDQGKFKPNSTLTRAQAAKMMVELSEKF